MAGFFSGFSSRAAVQVLFPWCSSLTGPCWEWEIPAQRHLCTLVGSVNQIWVRTYQEFHCPIWRLSQLLEWDHTSPMVLYPLLLDFRTVLQSCDCAGNDYKETRLRWPLWHSWKMLWMFKHIKYTQSAGGLCDLVMIGAPTDLLFLNPISVGASWTGKIISQ